MVRRARRSWFRAWSGRWSACARDRGPARGSPPPWPTARTASATSLLASSRSARGSGWRRPGRPTAPTSPLTCVRFREELPAAGGDDRMRGTSPRRADAGGHAPFANAPPIAPEAHEYDRGPRSPRGRPMTRHRVRAEDGEQAEREKHMFRQPGRGMQRAAGSGQRAAGSGQRAAGSGQRAAGSDG
jgi:hypothetical protein